MNTQDEQVLNHLLLGLPISSIEAIRIYGITRLAAIVSRLEKRDDWAGWIKHDDAYAMKNGRTVTYTIYRIG